MKATAVKERPILFSGPMIRALYRAENPKTQTRRILLPSDIPTGVRTLRWENQTAEELSHVARCKYGQPGDRLIPICSWAVARKCDKVRPLDLPKRVDVWTYHDGDEKPESLGKLRPGRFMPMWMRAAIPRLELTEVRVQRLQDISDADILAEGFDGAHLNCENNADTVDAVARMAMRVWYSKLWDSINGKRSPWSANDWVRALTFKRLEQP